MQFGLVVSSIKKINFAKQKNINFVDIEGFYRLVIYDNLNSTTELFF